MTDTITPDKLLTVEEIADWSGLRPETIRHEIHEGSLRAARFSNRYRIKPEDRDAWFDSRLVSPAAPSKRVDSPRGNTAKTAFGKMASQMDRAGRQANPTPVHAQEGC